MRIGIGRRTVEIAFRGRPGDLPRHAAGRYRGFLAEDPRARALSAEVTVDPGLRPPGWHPVHVDNPPLAASGDLERAAIRGEGFTAAFDWTRGTVRAEIPDSLAHLDLVLRVALGGLLLRDGSTFLHAAGAIVDGFALAFAGPSGAGKSTLAGILRREGIPVLADEMVVSLALPSAQRFRGTPFWEGLDREGPAGGIFLLEHGPGTVVEALPADRVLPRLVAAGGCPLDLPAFQEAFFAALATLLRRCPAYRLSFHPEESPLPGIRSLPEFAFFAPRRVPGRLLPAHPGGGR